jgi:CBS domain containing-hemolysin-like protein
MNTANENMTIQKFYEENPFLKFSRIPIYTNLPDNISGYILKDQLLEAIIKGNGEKTLKSIVRKIFITSRNLPIKSLFDKLIKEHEHIALVVDEYGSLSGLVTQEDIIETLLGLEIVDESDGHEDLQQLARKMWKIRAKRNGVIDLEIKDEE